MYVPASRNVVKNENEITKPVETAILAAGFNFSHGHLITNAGYDKEFENVFYWEEQYQGYLAWKAGYSLYTPTVQVNYHLWDRSYRPRFGTDAVEFDQAKQEKLDGQKKLETFENKLQGDRIRRIVYGDKEYIRYMDEVWGLDILG